MRRRAGPEWISGLGVADVARGEFAGRRLLPESVFGRMERVTATFAGFAYLREGPAYVLMTPAGSAEHYDGWCESITPIVGIWSTLASVFGLALGAT